MTASESRSFSVTQADVLYVVQQMKRDLVRLKKSYTNLITSERILDLHDNLTTFLINSAVSEVGFAIHDGSPKKVIEREIRYTIRYLDSPEGRGGTGGLSSEVVPIPTTAVFDPWVKWSQTMKNLTVDRQQKIVSGTGWGIPGSTPFCGTYSGGTTFDLASYVSGLLAVDAREYRR